MENLSQTIPENKDEEEDNGNRNKGTAASSNIIKRSPNSRKKSRSTSPTKPQQPKKLSIHVSNEAYNFKLLNKNDMSIYKKYYQRYEEPMYNEVQLSGGSPYRTYAYRNKKLNEIEAYKKRGL